MLPSLSLKTARIWCHIEITLVDITSWQFRSLRARELIATYFELIPFFNGFKVLIRLNIVLIALILGMLLLINPICGLTAFSLSLILLCRSLFVMSCLNCIRSPCSCTIDIEFVESLRVGGIMTFLFACVFCFEAHRTLLIWLGLPCWCGLLPIDN